MKVYVVTNINGDILGVADTPVQAVKIHFLKHGDYDEVANEKGYTEFAYLVHIGRIQEFLVNKFYYQ